MKMTLLLLFCFPLLSMGQLDFDCLESEDSHSGQNINIFNRENLLIDTVNTDSIRVLKNAFYLEILGNAITYSVNYERHIWYKKKFNTSVRIGASYFPFFDFVFPFETNVYLGKDKHYLEFGVGSSLQYQPKVAFSNLFGGIVLRNNFTIFATTRIGYRFQKKISDNYDVVIRVGFTPTMIVYSKHYKDDVNTILPLGGLSRGIAF